MQEEL
jgi:chromosome segregation ATPase